MNLGYYQVEHMIEEADIDGDGEMSGFQDDEVGELMAMVILARDVIITRFLFLPTGLWGVDRVSPLPCPSYG